MDEILYIKSGTHSTADDAALEGVSVISKLKAIWLHRELFDYLQRGRKPRGPLFLGIMWCGEVATQLCDLFIIIVVFTNISNVDNTSFMGINRGLNGFEKS